MQHPRIRNRFPHVFEAAHPRDASLDSHPEASVRDGAEATQIEIPLERLHRETVFLDALHEQIVVVETLAAADDLAVALGGEDVDTRARDRAGPGPASCKTPSPLPDSA